MPRAILGYVSWAKMKMRCNNANHASYPWYGGKGITYDPRWESFDVFITDLGTPPTDKHTLDRRDSNKGYTKSNCRWATRKEQAQNRKIRSDSPFKVAGVQQDSTGWYIATYYENGKQVRIKHVSLEAAIATRKAWEAKQTPVIVP